MNPTEVNHYVVICNYGDLHDEVWYKSYGEAVSRALAAVRSGTWNKARVITDNATRLYVVWRENDQSIIELVYGGGGQ